MLVRRTLVINPKDCYFGKVSNIEVQTKPVVSASQKRIKYPKSHEAISRISTRFLQSEVVHPDNKM